MKKIILVSMFTLVFAAIGLAQPGSILSWERGRLVRIEREARKVIPVGSSKEGACFARCGDETSAFPAPSSSMLKLNQYLRRGLLGKPLSAA